MRNLKIVFMNWEAELVVILFDKNWWKRELFYLRYDWRQDGDVLFYREIGNQSEVNFLNPSTLRSHNPKILVIWKPSTMEQRLAIVSTPREGVTIHSSYLWFSKTKKC